jgi:FAD/FMN-containing dehydrogenase
MAQAIASQADLDEALAGVRGGSIGPGDDDYEEARKLYNAMIDKQPRLIARCVDVADVIAAVNAARDLDLDVAIRGGGHSGPGLSSVDDGLVIDLSRLRGVIVDPDARVAHVLSDPANAGLVTDWAKSFSDALQPYSARGGYVNMIMKEGEGRVRAIYGPNYDRLAEVKAKYDPGNLFHVNQNIKPV